MGDFELEEVLFFIVSKGGRVRNHELVTHFKNFLNHPNNKAKNREKFKDYVNELASIKIDGGEKVLVLKKKYRPGSESFSSSASIGSSTSSSSLSASASSYSKSGVEAPVSAHSEPTLTPRKSSRETVAQAPPVAPPREKNASANDSPRAQSEPPNLSSGPNSQSRTSSSDGVDGGGMSRLRSDGDMEVSMRHSNRLMENEGSMAGSNASLTSTDSQKSGASSTSGVASMDDDPNSSVISVKDKIMKLNKIHSETDLNQPRQGGGGPKKNNKHWGGEDDDVSHSSGTSYVSMNAEQKEWLVVCSYSDYHDMNRLLSKNQSLAKLKDFTNGYTALHWAAKSGKAEVIKLIANKPGVYLDQRSHGGYTALHLAAIHGHEHIIELLVQTFKADANLRDYSGKKAKQYLKNSASSKAQQLLVSRRLGSDLNSSNPSLDDSFIRSASMRMSNRAKAMSSLLQVKSVFARQPLLRASWNGSSEDLYENKESKTPTKTPPGSMGSSPKSFRKKKKSKDGDLMPPPPNTMLARRGRYSDRSKSSSRESLSSPRAGNKNDNNQNMMRSESDPTLLEGSMT